MKKKEFKEWVFNGIIAILFMYGLTIIIFNISFFFDDYECDKCGKRKEDKSYNIGMNVKPLSWEIHRGKLYCIKCNNLIIKSYEKELI